MDPLNLLLISILLIIPPTTTAQFAFRHSWCSDDDTKTYTPNTTYHTNLNTILNLLSSDTKITYGFYNFTAGKPPNKVSSLALCRGDIPLNTCRVCIKNSAGLLPQICPNQKEAFGYSDYCSVFVSDETIYGHVQDSGELGLFTTYENFSDPKGYNQTVYDLLKMLRDQSASGNAELKFATGKLNISGTGSVLYGLVQCTPDLSRSLCVSCVQEAFDSYLPKCCTKQVSPFVLMKPSCSVRYDTSQFYGNVHDIPPPPPSTRNDSATIQSCKWLLIERLIRSEVWMQYRPTIPGVK